MKIRGVNIYVTTYANEQPLQQDSPQESAFLAWYNAFNTAVSMSTLDGTVESANTSIFESLIDKVMTLEGEELNDAIKNDTSKFLSCFDENPAAYLTWASMLFRSTGKSKYNFREKIHLCE